MSTTLGQMVTDGAGKITPHLHLAFWEFGDGAARRWPLPGCEFSRDPQSSNSSRKLSNNAP